MVMITTTMTMNDDDDSGDDDGNDDGGDDGNDGTNGGDNDDGGNDATYSYVIYSSRGGCGCETEYFNRGDTP